MIEIVFLAAVLVLLVASTLLIANTIRLSIFSRRREIEVMKLVGATNWFVRGPFMLEGLICGLVGSVAAVVLLLLGKELALPAILGRIDSSSDVEALSFSVTALILLVRRAWRRRTWFGFDASSFSAGLRPNGIPPGAPRPPEAA